MSSCHVSKSSAPKESWPYERPPRSQVLAGRSGSRWFVGGTYAGTAHTAEVPLRTGSGRWLVETVTDGPTGLVRTARTVRGGDTLSAGVISDGGFAAVACRWSPGRTSCDR